MNGKEGKNCLLHFRVTPEEQSVIEMKMQQVGIKSMSAYLRKMALDGYVIKLELPELREMISLLRRSSNNLNQIAQRVNSTNRIYTEDIEDIQKQQHMLWQCVKAILNRLAVLT